MLPTEHDVRAHGSAFSGGGGFPFEFDDAGAAWGGFEGSGLGGFAGLAAVAFFGPADVFQLEGIVFGVALGAFELLFHVADEGAEGLVFDFGGECDIGFVAARDDDLIGVVDAGVGEGGDVGVGKDGGVVSVPGNHLVGQGEDVGFFFGKTRHGEYLS